MADETPQIRIPDPSAVFCRVHGEYLRHVPVLVPALAAFIVTMMDAFVADEEVVEMAGGDLDRLTGLLPEFAPLCGRYRDQLEAAWVRAGVGQRERCEACGVVRLGGRQTLRSAGPIQPNYIVHICFKCCIPRACDPFKFGEWGV